MFIGEGGEANHYLGLTFNVRVFCVIHVLVYVRDEIYKPLQVLSESVSF